MSAVEEVFSEFGQEPLGAASLAQVHQARLTRDGSIVAVKIQHPDVGTNGYTDLGTMEVRRMPSCSLFTLPPSSAHLPYPVSGSLRALGVPRVSLPMVSR